MTTRDDTLSEKIKPLQAANFTNYPSWLNEVFAFLVFLFACVGLYYFYNLSGPTPPTLKHLFVFAPCGIVLSIMLVLQLFSYVSQYEITTWVILFSIGAACYMLYLAIIEQNPATHCALSAFAAGILGFALGIPLGKYRSAVHSNND